MNIQYEVQQVFFNTPLDLPFLQPQSFGPVIYGYGGCGGHLVVSPAPTCLPIYPSKPPTATEVPPPWHPPVDPPSQVPLPGTLALLALGVVMMKLVGEQR